MAIRTDLALEQIDLNNSYGKKRNGVEVFEENRHGLNATVVKINGSSGEKALGKPRGTYITMEIENVLNREKESFESAVRCISGYLTEFLKFGEGLPVLVVGLGNRQITPDAIGPLTADHILVTRHMVRTMPDVFGAFRPVSAFSPGVLGTTGMESAETVRALVDRTEAAGVICIDAIAARDTKRLCSTVQISDAGIAPGSGIGNHRNALSRSTLGVPVIAIGVPTVTDSATFAIDALGRAGVNASEEIPTGMIVTCSDIDKRVREVSRVLAYGINSALHKDLTVEDLSDLTY